MGLKLLFFLFVLFLQLINAQTNFYVSTSGSDSNDCRSLATPCSTIYGAILKDSTSTPKVINVGAGTFSGFFIFYYADTTLVGQGSSSTIINLGTNGIGFQVANVNIQNVAITGAVLSSGGIFSPYNMQNLNFQGVTIRNNQVGNLFNIGTPMNINFTDVVVRDNTCTNSGCFYAGAYATGTSNTYFNRVQWVSNTNSFGNQFDISTGGAGSGHNQYFEIRNSNFSLNLGSGPISFGVFNGYVGTGSITVVAYNSNFNQNQGLYGGAFRLTNGGSITLNSCTICGNIATNPNSPACLEIQSSGALTMNGGYYENNNCFSGAATLNIGTAQLCSALYPQTTAIQTTQQQTTALQTTAQQQTTQQQTTAQQTTAIQTTQQQTTALQTTAIQTTQQQTTGLQTTAQQTTVQQQTTQQTQTTDQQSLTTSDQTTQSITSEQTTGDQTTEQVIGKIQQSSKSGSSTAMVGGIVGAIFGVILCLLLLLLVILLVRRRKKNDNIALNAVEMKDEPKTAKATPSPSGRLNQFTMIPAEDIEVLSKLGEGSFGEVFKGSWNGTPVALKKLKDRQKEEAFLAEANSLAKLNHPNIVRFLGVWESQTHEIFIVTEFVSLGDLGDLLDKQNISLEKKVLMFQQLAAGMMYLEKNNIIHRDLALRNVLVTMDVNTFTVKISDLGLATTQQYYSQGQQSNSALPLRWVAPEVIRKRKFSSKSDVWSLGITFWEIITNGIFPYFQLSDTEVMSKVCDEGLRLEKPEGCPDALYQLFLDMWAKEPNQRPTFSEIRERLIQISKDTKQYEADQGLSKSNESNKLTKSTESAHQYTELYAKSPNSYAETTGNSGSSQQQPKKEEQAKKDEPPKKEEQPKKEGEYDAVSTTTRSEDDYELLSDQK